jgi:hypothetical protein
MKPHPAFGHPLLLGEGRQRQVTLSCKERGDRHRRWVRFLVASLLVFASQFSWADKVITKDGKTYTGKILIDTDKAVLIGNPPFDPNSTLIQADDIKTIVYEQYHPNSPAERRRGLAIGLQLSGNAYSSSELSLNPAAGMGLEGSFRFHPLFEIGGGIHWTPALSASGGDFTITSSTSPGSPSRSYHDFLQYTLDVTGKIYPFFNQKKWKTEPFILVGYGWSHLIPNDSGDSLSGGGWLLGFGAIRPLTEHVFIDGRFSYHNLSFDSVNFLGQQGTLSPEVAEHTYTLSLGLSYRI